MLLSFLIASLLGASEHPRSSEALVGELSPSPPLIGAASPARLSGLIPVSPVSVNALLRILTPIAKARTAKVAIQGLQECMEALGGVGYCENHESQEMNIARLYRDANVLSIWEGTTDVMATDLVKVITGRDGPRVLGELDNWVDSVLVGGSTALRKESDGIKEMWKVLRTRLAGLTRDQMIAEGRSVMQDVGDVVCAALLVVDALQDADHIAVECARRFVAEHFGSSNGVSVDWRDASRWDRLIAFGEDPGHKARL